MNRSITLFTVAILWSVYKWVTDARQLKSQETLCRDPTSLESVSKRAKFVKKAYWVSVVDGLIPSPSTVIIMTSLALLTGIDHAIFERRSLFAEVLSRYLDRHIGQASTFAGFNLEGSSGLLTTWSDSLSHVWDHTWIRLELLTKFYLVYLYIKIWLSTFWPRFHRYVLSKGLPKTMPPSGLTQVNKYVWEIYNPNEIPEMDIIFFHGLPVDSIKDAFWKTWLAKDDENVVWPKDWLSKKLPNARIYSVTYGFDLDLYAMGENLVFDIIMNGGCDIGQNCPVFLVGHCLGGIIIKQFILSTIMCKYRFKSVKEANRIRTLERFLENLKGAFFYATPTGSPEELENLRKVMHNNDPSLPHYVVPGPTQVARINAEFKQHCAAWNVRTSGVAESLPTTSSGINDVIVNEGSVRQNLDECYTHRKGDHFTVCRARSPEDPTVIKRLTRFIERCLNDH